MEEQIKAYIIKRLMARGVSQIDASGNANFLSRDISRTLESSITSLIGELPKYHSPGPKAAQRMAQMDRLREMNMFKGRKGGPP